MIDVRQAGPGLAGYPLLLAQLEALLADERDFIANAAQFSAFLFQELADLNWAGFYFVRGEELLLGPFQARWRACAFRLAVACAAPLRSAGKPSGWRMCMRSPGISPATAPPIAS